MSSKGKVPDAWDDEWEDQVNKEPQSTEDLIESLPKLSKVERRAKQAELNKRLWEEAETPKNHFYLETKNAVPLQSDIKPAVKVLSRKPAPTVIARRDPRTGVERLTLEDDDDEEMDSKPKTLTLEERKAKAHKEREEKQRKYEEARERLFGTSAPASGPGMRTSPQATASPSRASADRSKARGRGGAGGGSRPTSSAGSKQRQLYDPNYTTKPDSHYVQRQEGLRTDSALNTIDDGQIVRQPRGPDGTGRGGHGFDRARKNA